MPILSTFLGIVIRMFHRDHNPPHFHAEYGEFKTVIEISNGRQLSGEMPKRALRLIEEWRRAHAKELNKAWRDTQLDRLPKRIQPLE